jgi:hypothetical protein
METLTPEEKAPGAVPSRMLAVAETMIEASSCLFWNIMATSRVVHVVHVK